MGDDLLEAHRDIPALMPYLHLPVQSGSDRILDAMNRKHAAIEYTRLIEKIRRFRPDIAFSSDFIVGFPGETEEDFQYLLDWLTEAQLDRVGCFQYSPVEGAPANLLENPVPDEIKQDRWDRFMDHQQAISTARLQLKIGKEMDVLIDEVDDQGAVARCYADAPEIDGSVFINSTAINPGDKVRVRIVDADEYDMWAELI
jgi:ribosomal protein S12 methylthiotransferase